jgi:hypothetical protein
MNDKRIRRHDSFENDSRAISSFELKRDKFQHESVSEKNKAIVSVSPSPASGAE